MKARNLGPALSKAMSADMDVVIDIDGKIFSPDRVEVRGNVKVIIASEAKLVEVVEDKTPVIESSGVSEAKLVDLTQPTDEAEETDEVEETEAKADSADTDSAS